MNKNILIKIAVVLLVAILVHSVFWFFKTGQLEKHLNNFIVENNTNISVAEMKVTGYPLSQKIIVKDLKFTIPNPAFNKYQVIVKAIEARSGIFSNNFTIELTDKIFLQDSQGNIANVEFNQNPQISFAITNGIISNFSYSDSGYKALDIDKNIIYGALSSSINLTSAIDENDQITSKLNASVKEIEGFDAIDIYRNSFEKKIIDGIKTGEIAISGGASVAAISSDPAMSISSTTPVVSSAPEAVAASVIPNSDAAPSSATSSDSNPSNTESVAAKSNNAAKANLVIDIEYVLTPTKNEQQSLGLPIDPSQMQEVATQQYSRSVKVNNIEFSNNLYKIALNGQINYFQDDNLPSGFITTRVENLESLTNHIVMGFAQIAEQKQTIPEVQSSDLSAQSFQSQEVAYQNFLKKISLGISSISKELSIKNQLSKDNVAVFDMRREKNLEFVINETPLREVLGKF